MYTNFLASVKRLIPVLVTVACIFHCAHQEKKPSVKEVFRDAVMDSRVLQEGAAKQVAGEVNREGQNKSDYSKLKKYLGTLLPDYIYQLLPSPYPSRTGRMQDETQRFYKGGFK